MPPAKKVVTQSGRVALVKKKAAPTVSYEPELVLVRATRRGQYGVRQVVDAKSKNEKGRVIVKQVIERDAIIHNEGDVFEMDTGDMRKWPLEPGQHPHGDLADAEVIETASGSYELPSWVTYAGNEDETEATGHQTKFGNLGELTGSSVI
jgi:hypothetical protein